MPVTKRISVLFTGYAPSHFLCFRPLYNWLTQVPEVDVFVSGGIRTTTDHGYVYDSAGMYGSFDVPPERILSVDAIQKRSFDVLFSANKRIITPIEKIKTRVMIFQGLSFRNRGVRPENLAYTTFMAIGPYMCRKFSETGLMAENDPRLVPIGFPKTDPLLNGSLDRHQLLTQFGFDGSRPVLLYAPTGQAYNSLETMGPEVIRRLSASGQYDLLIKPHDHPANPALNEVDTLSHLVGPHTCVVRELDVIPLLFLADLLITDASSVANEYALLNRPLVFLDVPELIQASRDVGAVVDLESWGRRGGVVVKRPDEVEAAVTSSLSNPERLAPIRAAMARDLFFNPGKATEAASDWFIDQFLT